MVLRGDRGDTSEPTQCAGMLSDNRRARRHGRVTVTDGLRDRWHPGDIGAPSRALRSATNVPAPPRCPSLTTCQFSGSVLPVRKGLATFRVFIFGLTNAKISST